MNVFRCVAVALLLALCHLRHPAAHAFYLPGLAPKNYKMGDPVDVDVNALFSKETILPFDYYHPKFGFCRPPTITARSESLGSILFGDRLYNSPFQVSLLCFHLPGEWPYVLQRLLMQTPSLPCPLLPREGAFCSCG